VQAAAADDVFDTRPDRARLAIRRVVATGRGAHGCDDPEKYCHNGGMAFAQQHRGGGSWSTTPVGGKSCPSLSATLSPRSSPFAGKARKGQRFAPLWGQRWVRLPFHDGSKYWHNGGTTFAVWSAQPHRP